VTVHLFESPLPGSLWDPIRVDALHGETLGGSPFSLLDGEVVGPTTITPSSARTADIAFAALVEGGHVTTLDEVAGNLASVGLHDLREFLRGGGFGTPLLNVSADRECVAHCTVDFDWGSLQLLAAGVQTKWSRDETRTEVKAHAQLRFREEAALSTVDAVIEPLRDLVSFSTGRASYVTGLSLLTAGQAQAATPTSRGDFKVIRRPEADPQHVPRARLPLLLNPATVPQGIGILQSWFALRGQLGPVWPLFFSTIFDPWLPPESQLLNLTAFAEGYHRTLHDEPPLPKAEAAAAVATMLEALPENRTRELFRPALSYANSQSQRARIRWLTRRALAALPAWQLDAREFTSQIADTRNWHTHWGERGGGVQEGDDLLRLARRLYLVLSVNLLLDLGVESADVAPQLETRLQVTGLP
jgi:hypothetical protein